MVARKTGRYLAPLALVAVIVAVVLVVRAGVGHSVHTPAPRATTGESVAHHTVRRAFYVVRPGDSLSTISAKTGVPMTTLTSLNPAVDPNALQVGQRLRLHP